MDQPTTAMHYHQHMHYYATPLAHHPRALAHQWCLRKRRRNRFSANEECEPVAPGRCFRLTGLKRFHCAPCNISWWDCGCQSECRQCQRVVASIPLDKMAGVFWHHCQCGRVYWARSFAPVNCPSCNGETLPHCVMPDQNKEKCLGPTNSKSKL